MIGLAIIFILLFSLEGIAVTTSWAQPPGTAVGTPNWGQDISRVYDGNADTWCEMDETVNHTTFPYAYFGVVFNNPVELHGIKFRNWLSEWNHITSFEVWALPFDLDNVEENWQIVVPQTSSLYQYDWIEALFSSPIVAKQVHIRYLSIIGNYAASVGEIEFLVPGGTLSVSPDNNFASSGVQGGLFTPSYINYTITNTGWTPIQCNISKNASWLDISYADVSLEPGENLDLIVSINSIANNLSPGSYSDIIIFENISNGNGSTSREVTLAVSELFTEINTSLIGLDNGDAVWGDYDNDGDMDVILTGIDNSNIYQTKIYKNEGNNSFIEQTDISLEGLRLSSAAWGDYDNDGDLDTLLTGVNDSEVKVSKLYKNNGNNSFVEQNNFTPNGGAGSVDWGDYDNDGDLDVLLSGIGANGRFSHIYKNNGDNTFTLQPDINLMGVLFSNADWGDYDNDGDLDIILTGNNGSDEITRIYENNGDNIFNEHTDILLTQLDNSSVAWGDYDNDGDLDILLAGGFFTGVYTDELTEIYKNNGDGTFTLLSNNSLIGVVFCSVDWGDYDNDGDLDILITGMAESMYYPQTRVCKIYKNNGNDTFIEQISISLPGVLQSSASWGDYDSDGDLDIILNGQESFDYRISKIYRNNCTIPNTPPNHPFNLNAEAAENTVTLNWNKSSDNETPQNGLTYNLRVGTSPGQGDIVSPMALSNGKRKIVAMGSQNHNTSWTIKNLEAGTYYWSVQAIDTGFMGSAFAEEQTFTITGDGTLSVNPPTNLDSSGYEGGPFNPSSKTYTLTNTGGNTIDYNISKNANWLDLSSTSGSLGAGDSIDVAVSINNNAYNLGEGSYTDTISFTNTTNGNGSTSLSVNLEISVSPGLTNDLDGMKNNLIRRLGNPTLPWGDVDKVGIGNSPPGQLLIFSESVSYALFLNVLRTDAESEELCKQKFKDCWEWAKGNLQRKNIQEVYSWEVKDWIPMPEELKDNLMAWRWVQNVNGTGQDGIIYQTKEDEVTNKWHDGSQVASDGDLLTAYALYLAYKRGWGEGIEYLQDAVEIVTDLRKKAVIDFKAGELVNAVKRDPDNMYYGPINDENGNSIGTINLLSKPNVIAWEGYNNFVGFWHEPILDFSELDRIEIKMKGNLSDNAVVDFRLEDVFDGQTENEAGHIYKTNPIELTDEFQIYSFTANDFEKNLDYGKQEGELDWSKIKNLQFQLEEKPKDYIQYNDYYYDDWLQKEGNIEMLDIPGFIAWEGYLCFVGFEYYTSLNLEQLNQVRFKVKGTGSIEMRLIDESGGTYYTGKNGIILNNEFEVYNFIEGGKEWGQVFYLSFATFCTASTLSK